MTEPDLDPVDEAYVYAIGPTDGPQKIGVAINPRSRKSELQVSSHVRFSLNASVAVSRVNARTVEKCCHSLLKENRIRGEWFDVTPKQANEAIKQAISMVLAGWEKAEKQTKIPIPAMHHSELKAWRKRLGWSQAEAANHLGCGRRSFQVWESGTNKIPHYIGLACAVLDLGITEYSPEWGSG